MESDSQTKTKYLMVTACAGLFTFGALLAFLGATLPELRARLGFGMQQTEYLTLHELVIPFICDFQRVDLPLNFLD